MVLGQPAKLRVSGGGGGKGSSNRILWQIKIWHKNTHFQIALVYFLLLIPWPPTNVLRILCSRDNSRLVRKIVRSKWTPILDKHQVSSSPSGLAFKEYLNYLFV